MFKDKYYFSHDYNARNDRKIAALIKDHKSSGYGIFWATCEMMHEEGGSLELDDLTINAIANDMNETPSLVESILEDCVTKYKLFTKQNEAETFASLLHSSRVIRNLDGKNEKKKVKAESGRLGGIKSGESRRNNNHTKQNEAERSTASSIEPKESKVKERKDIIVAPAIVKQISPPMTNDDLILFQSKLIQEAVFIDQLMPARGIPNKTAMLDWIKVFNVHIAGEEKLNKDYGEYKRHFKNWIVKQESNRPPPVLSSLEKIRSAGYVKPEKEVDFDKYRKTNGV